MDYHILIVEDDKDIREGIEIYLKNQGYTVFQAADGVEGLAVLKKETIHLAIVDVMMPRMDGINMMMRVREQGFEFPVIMLSAKSEEVDKIMGLNMGADDYVTKPFTNIELFAIFNSHLRRYSRYLEMKEAGDGKEEDHNVFTVGGLEVHEETVEVFLDGSPIRLTPTEFKILLLLIKSPGRVFSAEEIYERVWNEQAINTDTIMVHIRKIREKIELNPRDPKYLKVVWGVGYKIEKQGRNGTGSKSRREKSEA
ncbi:MAG: response regulator transcription factor [Lachnospiraceae bacterium]|nr:response regulator transcription factor [Lachnospiraceae bacterium]